MAGTVGSLALNAVVPSFYGAIDNRRGLVVLDFFRQFVRNMNLVVIVSVRYADDVKIVDIEEFHRVPLHIVAGVFSVGSYALAFNRGFVPVNMKNRVL